MKTNKNDSAEDLQIKVTKQEARSILSEREFSTEKYLLLGLGFFFFYFIAVVIIQANIKDQWVGAGVSVAIIIPFMVALLVKCHKVDKIIDARMKKIFKDQNVQKISLKSESDKPS
jgi:hypothetical protein